MRHTFFILFLFTFFSTQAQTVYPDSNDGQLYLKIKNEYPVGEYTGKTIDASAIPQIKAFISKYGITKVQRPFYIKQSLELGQVYRIYFTEVTKVDAFIKDLQQDATVEYAERVPLVKTTLAPDDLGMQSYSNGNWALFKINAQQAWDVSTGNPAVKIAIVDNAIDITHEDLAGNIYINTAETLNGIDDDSNGYIDDINGWDAGDDDNNPNPTDTAAHGTHVAGIAAAKTNNNTGIASIGYNCTIIPVKMAETQSNDIHGYDGVAYAVAAGANVISLSWGGTDSSQIEQLIMNNVYANGITVFAAAGNSSDSTKFYPAAYNYVIAVASSGNGGSNDQKSSFSKYGSWVDICAPGIHIKSTVLNNQYEQLDGTSMATPMVAGLAGLLLSARPDFTPDSVEHCLKSTAVNIDAANPNYIGKLGAGRIDAYQALRCAVPVGIDENILDNNIIVAPNFDNTSVSIKITLPSKQPVSVTIYGVIWQLITSYDIGETIGGNYSIPLPSLVSGVYFADFSIGNKHITKRFVISQ